METPIGKDLTNPATADTVLSNCTTKILLPSGPQIDVAEYDALRLSDAEFAKILTTG
jgi:type IV secretory pathway VirB4 component